jgi:hypothetical protein
VKSTWGDEFSKESGTNKKKEARKSMSKGGGKCVACRVSSGNIQNIQGTFRAFREHSEHSGNIQSIQGTFREHSGHI